MANVCIMCLALLLHVIAEIIWIVVSCFKPRARKLKIAVAVCIGFASEYQKPIDRIREIIRIRPLKINCVFESGI